MKIVETKDLQLGDVVTPHPRVGPWDAAIVCKIDKVGQFVTLHRPYGAHADFAMSGGPNVSMVICYTGLECYSVGQASSVKWELHVREALK